MWWCHFPGFFRQLKFSGWSYIHHNDHILFCCVLSLTAEPLLSYMQIVSEIVVPTVCTLCILIAAVLLVLLLRSLSWDRVIRFVAASFTENLQDLLQGRPHFSASKIYIHFCFQVLWWLSFLFSFFIFYFFDLCLQRAPSASFTWNAPGCR